MPLFTSAIPMPTSVTIMDPCDPSMHITDLNPEFVNRCTHRSHNRPRAALLNEIASRTPCGNGVTTGLSEVQQARLQPRPSATRSALSLDGLVKSPAPDEYIDHMSATNTTTSTSITCRQLTLLRLRRDYQNLMTVQSQAWLTYRSSSRQRSKRSEGSVTAKTSWRLTPMRNARDQLSSPLLPLTSELPSTLSVSRSWSNDSCGRYHFGREVLGQGGNLR